MKKRLKLKYINLNNLELDINNPRFGELYNGSTNEDDLIEYLLYEEAAEEIAAAIVKKQEFYEDKALWVIKKNNGKYIVRDGNRRCAAVKALQLPAKYKLSIEKFTLKELPVYEYTSEDELKARISEEHAASLFRSWERIAKALQIIDLAENGKHEDMNDLDSRPGDFIKLGSFYMEAVKYGGDKFRKQLRRGRGKNGGKTIIYERLFRDCRSCGYRFRNSPSFKIEITDKQKFESYITSLVDYIEAYPDIKTSSIDDDKHFIKKLKDFGFDPNALINTSIPSTNSSIVPTIATTITSNSANSNGQNTSLNQQQSVSINNSSSPSVNLSNSSNRSITAAAQTTRYSVKRKPDLKRKKIPAALKKLVDECFDINKDVFPNSKTALTRVTFECCLKYVIENTQYVANKKLCESNHFRNAFYDRQGKKLTYTNFTNLKNEFTELILNTGIKNAFNTFSLDIPHQIIHNYHTSASPANAESICNNLIPLIEFMLQDEQDLKIALDSSKL